MYRTRAERQREAVLGANYQVWTRLLEWQLDWEHKIMCYRDSNNGEDEA